MKLRTRLLAGVSIYQLLLAAVGLIGFPSAQASLRGMEVAVDHHVAELSELGALASDVNRIHSLALQHALTESAAEQGAYDAEIRRSEEHASALIDQLLRVQERFNDSTDSTDFRATWREYLHVVDDEILPRKGPGHQAEFAALTSPDGPLLRPYGAATRKLTALQAALPTEATEHLNLARDDFGRNRDLLLVATLLAGVLGLGLDLHQSARLARAVEAVSQAARRVAGGDLTQRVRVTTGGLEIESLAESFNIMTNNLQQMTTAQGAHLSELAFVRLRLSDLTTARSLAREAVALARDVGDPAILAAALQRAGEVMSAFGKYAETHNLLRESFLLARQCGDRWRVAVVREVLVGAAAAAGQPCQAMTFSGLATRLREMLKTPLSPMEQAALDRRLAAVRAELGDQPAAEAWAEAHVSSILRKLELSSRAQLAVWVVAHERQPHSLTA